MRANIPHGERMLFADTASCPAGVAVGNGRPPLVRAPLAQGALVKYFRAEALQDLKRGPRSDHWGVSMHMCSKHGACLCPNNLGVVCTLQFGTNRLFNRLWLPIV